jgi:hypothetical protein
VVFASGVARVEFENEHVDPAD